MFTHTHLDDGREHVTCARCHQAKTFPARDDRGIRAWKLAHHCPRPRRRDHDGPVAA